MLRLPGVHFRFVVIVFVLQLSFQIEAYQFAPSCKHYANGDKDLTHGLRDSMGEANSMATLALNSITEDEQFNDARKMLWKGAGPADFSESHDKYQGLLDRIPWENTEDDHRLIIFCGSGDFERKRLEKEDIDDPDATPHKEGDWYWFNTHRNEAFFLDDSENYGDSQDICLGQGQQPGEGSDWAHSIYPEDEWEEDQEHWLILCADALAKPFTIEGLKESKTLKGHIDDKVKSVVSVTLLHELFHAAWHRQMAGAEDELNGWAACVQAPLDQAKIMPETHALFGAALKVTDVDPDQSVIGGYLMPAPLVEAKVETNPEEAQEQFVFFIEHQ